MTNLKKIKKAYFIGIGGIGMSAIARFFNSIGIEVRGYDKTKTHLTDELINEGIEIHFEENLSLITSNPDLVIYTPAIPSSHIELKYFFDNGFNVKKRSVVLGEITGNYFTIAVAGTHGKTSISTMISHILYSSGEKITSFIGGISKNFNTNFINTKDSELIIVEADEYDRSFLTLNPDIAVVSSTDADHLDIYGTKENLELSFKMFTNKIKKSGSLIINEKLHFVQSIDYKTLNYSVSNNSDYYAENIRIIESDFVFDLVYPKGKIKDIKLGVPGKHNVENAVAASAVALLLNIDEIKIKKALASYSGVYRRFDYQIKRDDFVFIDDYAHHPQELKAIITAVKEIYSDKSITGVFQPHLYSRTRDFADEFAESLSLLDDIVLLDIYPARELPIEGVTSSMLLAKIKSQKKCLAPKTELIKLLKAKEPEVLITLGAGDIDQFVEPIKKAFENQ